MGRTHPFMNVLMTYREQITDRMMSYFYDEVGGLSDLTNDESETLHWDLMADYPKRGGKYIRPTILIVTGAAMGVSPEDSLQTAVALEISQNWLLVHDDVEDQALRRRGEPTLHRKYGSEALAINAGDGLHLLMWRILRDNEPVIGAAKTFEVIDEFHRMLFRTCVGQTAEILFQKRLDFTEEDYFYIIDGKTSYYTVAGGMRLGAILASEDPAHLKKHILPLIDDFGCSLGRAFQITDDILDITSEGDGKQRGGDIYEGKITLLLWHLLKNASAGDRHRVEAIMSKPRPKIEAEEVEAVISMMESYGSIDYARSRAAELADKARETFKDMDFLTEPDARQSLKHGIDFIIARGS